MSVHVVARTAVVVALLAVPVSSVVAQGGGHSSSDIGIAVRAGTLGFGGEISKLLVSHVGIRVGFGYFSITDKGASIGNNKADFKAEIKAFSGLLDFYPSPRGSFHLTGGVMTKPADVTGTGSNTGGSYSFNGNSYSQAAVGTLTVEAKFPSAMPYVGLGFGTAASDHGGLSFVFDLGLAIGKPVLSFAGSNVTSGSQIDTDIKAEAAKQQTDKADKIPGWPVLAIGFMYRF